MTIQLSVDIERALETVARQSSRSVESCAVEAVSRYVRSARRRLARRASLHTTRMLEADSDAAVGQSVKRF